MPARIGLFAPASRWLTCLAALAFGLFGLAPDARATFYQVNSPADEPDADLQTAACETVTGNGICTLRAAVQQANAHAGADTILVPPNTYVLSRVGQDDNALNGDLDVTEAVTIIGAGAGSTIIDGNSAVTGDRVFDLRGSITVKLIGLTIQHGVAIDGGGIVSQANLTTDGCFITGNSAATRDAFPAAGGGIYNGGSLVLKNSVVSDNTASALDGHGGGIYSRGPLTISNSTFSGNASAGGGGLYAETYVDVVITNSTFSGNSANFGGAIYTTVATAKLVNDTISGNSSDADGGGIYADFEVFGLYNVTVAGNQANADKVGTGGGAGIYSHDASVTLNNSILSGNNHLNEGSPFATLADCSGTLASSGNNIVTAPSCTINGPHSPGPAKLGPLQDNGGATPTHALLSGSPALDAGGICLDEIGAPLGADQRGVSRPQGAACDIGAFELEDLVFADGFEPGT